MVSTWLGCPLARQPSRKQRNLAGEGTDRFNATVLVAVVCACVVCIVSGNNLHVFCANRVVDDDSTLLYLYGREWPSAADSGSERLSWC